MMKLQYIVVSMAPEVMVLAAGPHLTACTRNSNKHFFSLFSLRFGLVLRVIFHFCCRAILRERNKIHIYIHMNVYVYRISGLCHEDA